MSLKRLLAVVVMVVTLMLTVIIDKGVAGLLGFWNAPSLVLPLVVVICFLIAADSFGDFVRGFKIANGLGECTMKELKSSKNAYDLAVRLVALCSVLMFFIGGINVLGNPGYALYNNGSAEAWEIYSVVLAILSLTLLYGLIGLMVIYSVRAKIIKEIIYRES